MEENDVYAETGEKKTIIKSPKTNNFFFISLSQKNLMLEGKTEYNARGETLA